MQKNKEDLYRGLRNNNKSKENNRKFQKKLDEKKSIKRFQKTDNQKSLT